MPRELSQAFEYEACTSGAFSGSAPPRPSQFPKGIEPDARACSLSSDMQIEIHRWLAETWLRWGRPRYARLHHQRAGVFAASASEAEDTLALDRIALELQVDGLGTPQTVRELQDHADRACRLGFGYEQLLTSQRIAALADNSPGTALAADWWRRTEFLAERCGATALMERWRRERAGSVPNSADPAGLDALSAAGAEDEEDADLADEMPSIDLETHGIITRSAKVRQQAGWIAKLAPTDVAVLIRGQSGTGKELFAHLVHALSPRSEHPFLAINCGALPGEIIESELFGHRRGAFTGAVSDKPGLFREAHRGTLFLDEIGEMTGSAQAKLLRVLETGEFRPVGGLRYEQVDVRIVAATNVDLDRAVRERKFRKDLFFRLKGLEVFLPPLRERLADVPVLAQHFLRRANRRQDKAATLGFETVQWLMGQPWPGNIRELKLAVERAVALGPEAGPLFPRHFIGVTPADEISSLPEELEEIERARVINALEASEWNTAAAARLLGMSRTTLAGRIKKLGIRKPRRG